MITRRRFLRLAVAAGAGLALPWQVMNGQALASPVRRPPGRPTRHLLRRRLARFSEAVPGGTLDPTAIPKYEQALIIPPAMPSAGRSKTQKGKTPDNYVIAVRQFEQQILPPSMLLPKTTVWSYGAANDKNTLNYPAFTIEAKYNTPVRVKWVNGLVDGDGHFLPHLLPVDQTLNWANPPSGPDSMGTDQEPYRGPVPIVSHVHGAHTGDESDGYAEAWFLPKANNIPVGFATVGSWYNFFKAKFETKFGDTWEAGSATFQYPNDQRATTLWYHDHSMGMTRTNVYAGPAGFYIIRGGPDDAVGGKLPGPAPARGDAPGTKYYEILIAVQDRSFNADGSLFYPGNRAFFEGLAPDQLQIPFMPDPTSCGGESDVAPIWNPEFFGNTMVVNGRTWPYLEVEPRRYRFRFLDGCNARYLILKFENNMPFYQIGAEGGFLPAPVQLSRLLMSPAERADVIVDFTGMAPGTRIKLLNFGPDEPFPGGEEGVAFQPSDPATTGQVMEFRIVPLTGPDTSTPPLGLVLPKRKPLGAETNTRQVSLNELISSSVKVVDVDGSIVENCDGVPFGPTAARLGTMVGGFPVPYAFMDDVTEKPAPGTTELWEIYNFTVDAHPIHLHQVAFEVVNRQALVLTVGEEPVPVQPVELAGAPRPPEPWERGTKDTVTAYPGEVTRIKATFDLAGQYVWHCHIVEHEDNEMMRPMSVGPVQTPVL